MTSPVVDTPRLRCTRVDGCELGNGTHGLVVARLPAEHGDRCAQRPRQCQAHQTTWAGVTACAWVCAAALLASACGASSGAPDPPTQELPTNGTGSELDEPPVNDAPPLRVRVTWPADEGPVAVHLLLDTHALPGDPSPELVELRWREKYLGEAFADEQVELLGTAPDVRWADAAVAGADGRIDVRYTVTLAFDIERSPYGRGGVHFPIQGGWHLLGRSLVPDVWVDDEAVDIPARFTIDPGARRVATAAGLDVLTFDASSIRLADRFMVVSDAFESHALSVGAADVPTLIVSPDLPADALVSMGTLTGDIVALVEAWFGPLPAPALMASFYEATEGEWGSAWVDSVVQVGPWGPPGPIGRSASSVWTHELIHLWLPGDLMVSHNWLDEGLTDYFTILAVNELAGEDPVNTARVLHRSWLAYATEIGERTVSELGEGRLAYDAGTAIAWCTDAHLRARTDGATGLADVLGDLLATHPDEMLFGEDLAAAVAEVDAEVADMLRRWMATIGPIDPASCLAASGLELVESEWEGFADRTLAVDWLHIYGLREHTKLTRFTVLEAADDSVLRPGDQVVRVAGRPVANLADVDRALRDVEPGTDVVIDGVRDGTPFSRTLRMPDAGWGERATRTYVEVRSVDG